MKNNDLMRANELRSKIAYYDQLYYEKGISEISDAEYDRLYKEYEDLERKYPELKDENSPTNRVGGLKQETLLPKFTHKSPLLSIDRKAKDLDELEDFYKKIGGDGVEVIIEPKFDGITVNLNYEGGKFVNAATRGNGYIGDLITDNFKNTDSQYPQEIKDENLEIRGEAIIPYDFFKKNLEDEYSNPRNAVSGILRQIEPNDVKGKGLKTIFYDIGSTSTNIDNSDSNNVKNIKSYGFQETPYIIANSWELLKTFVETKMAGIIQNIDGFNVLIKEGFPQAVCDGLVIKVNDLKLRNEIGMSQKGPKWAFAYKFKPLQANTVINSIDWQIGKTGKVTPVANFATISLGGTKINRATLNNYDYMCNLPIVKENGELDLEHTSKVEYGDTIIVERSNDVIPRIVAIKEKLGRNCYEPQSIELQKEIQRKRITFNEPTVCPECGAPLVKEGPLHFCKNYDCPEQIKRRLIHFASRDAMNIVGLGESVVDQIFEKLDIRHLDQIYDLKENELSVLEAFKDKKSNNLIKAINNSKTPELWNFIYSLSIDNVGKKTAKDLATRYQTINNFLKATKEELLQIEDIGDIVADSIVSFLKEHSKDVNYLLEYVSPKKASKLGDKFLGKTFVITGTLENSRDYYVKLIEAQGGKVSNSVSKKTNYVLIGTDAGSKEAKAKELVKQGADIKILESEDEISKLLTN